MIFRRAINYVAHLRLHGGSAQKPARPAMPGGR